MGDSSISSISRMNFQDSLAAHQSRGIRRREISAVFNTEIDGEVWAELTLGSLETIFDLYQV